MGANLSEVGFGTYIRQQREQQGVLLCELASRVGVSAAYWSRIERERENPPKDEFIESAARALGVNSDMAFAAARRLPPDMRPHLREVVRMYRERQRTGIPL